MNNLSASLSVSLQKTKCKLILLLLKSFVFFGPMMFFLLFFLRLFSTSVFHIFFLRFQRALSSYHHPCLRLTNRMKYQNSMFISCLVKTLLFYKVKVNGKWYFWIILLFICFLVKTIMSTFTYLNFRPLKPLLSINLLGCFIPISSPCRKKPYPNHVGFF